MASTILCIRKEPGKAPEVVQIENTLEALQHEVGGYIETVTIAADLTIVVNEEGMLRGLPYNANICGRHLFGTILAVGVRGDEFVSIPAAKVMNYMRLIFGKEDAACDT